MSPDGRLWMEASWKKLKIASGYIKKKKMYERAICFLISTDLGRQAFMYGFY